MRNPILRLHRRFGRGVVIGPEQLLILHLIAIRPRPSLRGLASMVGSCHQTVKHHLENLCELGLATYDRGKAKTARPTCRFITAAQLEEAAK